ncbi:MULTISPECIES: GntR family transcriptional regulator [Streptomyces]|uniref:GntR family transcriptional regulator n=1 Tax=Streptomyces cremeus TaxID=66881 RepID=A0ABV5P9F4_STRCM
MSSSDEWASSTSTPYLAPRATGQSDAWTAETAAAGRRGTQTVVRAGEVPASEDVAALFGVTAGTPLVARRRIMQLDGIPSELTDTYYPSAIALGTPLAGTAKIRGGAVTLLAELGHVGVRVREEVTARMPDAAEREALHMGEGEPVLRLTRVTLDADDRPIQADVMLMPAHSQRLRYEIRIG